MFQGEAKTYVSIDEAENWKRPPLADKVLHKFVDAVFRGPN